MRIRTTIKDVDPDTNKLSDLTIGAFCKLYVIGHEVYIVSRPEHKEGYFLTNLRSGVIYKFEATTLVYPIDGEVVRFDG